MYFFFLSEAKTGGSSSFPQYGVTGEGPADPNHRRAECRVPSPSPKTCGFYAAAGSGEAGWGAEVRSDQSPVRVQRRF